MRCGEAVAAASLPGARTAPGVPPLTSSEKERSVAIRGPGVEGKMKRAEDGRLRIPIPGLSPPG